MNTLHQTAVSFVGQNYGAQKYKRIGIIAGQCILIVAATGLILGNLFYFSGGLLLRLYAAEEAVIAIGLKRMLYICCPYFLCGVMDTLVGCLRGMGHSVLPMLVSLTGACVFRVVWIYTVFQTSRTLETLYISYPISWALTAMVHFGCFLFIYLRLLSKEKKVCYDN